MNQGRPDYVAMPTALDFSACPTKDELGNIVDGGVFPDQKTVVISNRSNSPGTFVPTFSGTGADRFSLASMPMGVGSNEDIEVPVQFSPDRRGDVQATLTIDDGDPETKPITVDLTGTGKNLPAQPTLEVSFEQADGGFAPCIAGVLCQQEYPATLLGETKTLRVRLRNLGCPALNVTGLSLEKTNAGGDQMAYTLEQPVQVPSSSNPLVMSTADGTDEKTLVIRFAPEEDGSNDTQRFAVLSITSNDFVNPLFTISLSGEGVTPALGALPTSCRYNEALDICKRTGTKEANFAEFTLVNDGTSDLKIDSALFRSTGMNNSGSGGRFTVMNPVDGQTLTVGQSTVLRVQHTDLPLFVVDVITVSASIPGQPAGSLARIPLTVSGGTKPCLATEPDDKLTFADAGTELTTKTVTVKALAMRPGTMTPCGTLVVEGVEIPPEYTQFSVVAPLLTANQEILAGSQADITVQFKKPITGGRQAGELIIKTNDTDFAAPSYKKLLLESDNPLNPIPECDLRVCPGSMATCTTPGNVMVRLSQLGMPKTLTLWGGESVDPMNETLPNKGIAEWKFRASAPSGNVPNWSLTGGNVFTTQNYQTLTLNPTVTGDYLAFLWVKDVSGQETEIQCQVRISVYP
ncbi:MAG: choice-of-anchor D domain-containing protein [Myxococcaceae bacterium]|nr:choice-of-anchor D domain-containing protein [Myxococcaceae bacterium]